MPDIKTYKKEAYEKAVDSLARYKFMQFGYWAAIWVHLNNIDVTQDDNPFKSLVKIARSIQQKDAGQLSLEVERE